MQHLAILPEVAAAIDLLGTRTASGDGTQVQQRGRQRQRG